MDLELIENAWKETSRVASALSSATCQKKSQISSGVESKNKNRVVTIRTVERWKRNLQMVLW